MCACAKFNVCVRARACVSGPVHVCQINCLQFMKITKESTAETTECLYEACAELVVLYLVPPSPPVDIKASPRSWKPERNRRIAKFLDRAFAENRARCLYRVRNPRFLTAMPCALRCCS